LFGIPQPTPFDLHWRMFGIDVRVHPFFWLMAVVIGWFWFELRGIPFLLLWVLCVFVSVLAHEMGHVLMGRRFGSYGHILLYSFGGLAFDAGNVRERWQRVLVSFAGPFAQFLLLLLVIAASSVLLPEWRELVTSVLLRDGLILVIMRATVPEALVTMLLLINFYWTILNLLPIYPLDGGHISREILEGLLGHRGLLISLGVSLGLAALLAVQMVWPIIPHFPYRGGVYMAIFFALMAVSSYQLLQLELNRRPRRYEDDRLPWE
jgi:stage IV sporulation protein FB